MSFHYLQCQFLQWLSGKLRTSPKRVATRTSRRRQHTLSVESLEGRQLLASVYTNFADLTLPANSFFNGPDLAGTTEPDPFGGTLPVTVGSFKSGGATFSNKYNANFGSWSGFAYSNVTDNSTAGFGNQHSSFAGAGLGDAKYAVAFGDGSTTPFDPTSAASLAELPNIALPVGGTVADLYVTNSTYAALSMRDGDDFAKQFGGASGNDPDWFKLTAYGTNAAGQVLPNSAEIYLADYRFADNTKDFILEDWTKFNLTALVGANRIYFNLTSSDVGTFGMNTPATFALDNLRYNLPSINRAPVLDNSIARTLNPIVEDATNPAGTSITSLTSQGITDADTGAVKGIAIVGASHRFQGTWQYSLNNGTSWLPLGNPSPSAVRLLPATATTKVRFVPNPNFSGVVSLTYHAWDQTRGTPGGTLNASGAGRTGGSSALSIATETATLAITPVNDAPVLGGISGVIPYTRGAAPIAIAPTPTVSDVDSFNFAGGLLTVQITTGLHASNRIELDGTLFKLNTKNEIVRVDAINGNKIIGTLNASGGVGLTKFEVTLNVNAKASIVVELLQQLKFSTLADSTLTQRTFAFTLTDGDGGTSNKVTRKVTMS
jgi:Domain of unknown function (DUF4465)